MKELTTFEKECLIKQKANNSLYYFARNILGYHRLTPRNEEWCWELELGKKKTLHLTPRKTYKTTVKTKAYPLWRLKGDRNLRILLVNEIGTNSSKFLREIKTHCERNEIFRHFYGDLVSDKWSESEIIVNGRTANYSEGSITAVGFGSKLISAHYDIIICDDLVGLDDRASATTRAKKIEFFKDIQSLLDEGGEIHVVGTRWHYDDLYNYIMNDLNPSLLSEGKTPYSIICQRAIDEKGESNFPDIFSKETLREIELNVGVVLFQANYLNEPLSEGSRIFNLSDLKLYNHREYMSNGAKNAKNYAYLDPSLGKVGSDYVALLIGSVPEDGFIRLVKAMALLIPPSKQVDLMIELQREYNFVSFGIEANGFQDLLKEEVKRRSAKAGVYIPIKPVIHKTNKNIRIESAEPTIKQYVLFRDDWKDEYEKAMKQIIEYPASAHDDVPDGLEGLVSMIKKRTLQIF